MDSKIPAANRRLHGESRTGYVRSMDMTYHLNGGLKPTLKRFADLGGPDFYPTPGWATRALVENERFEGEIWEPACGDGAMSTILAESGNQVFSSDLYDRGFGEVGLDFLASGRKSDNIVTNPHIIRLRDLLLQRIA